MESGGYNRVGEGYSVLLADDDRVILAALGEHLSRWGYDVSTVDHDVDAVKILRRRRFDIVITDLVFHNFPTAGFRVLNAAKRADKETMVMVLTGYPDMASAVTSLRLNADDLLMKPCETPELHFRIGRCVETIELRRQVRDYERIIPVCCVCGKIRDDESTGKGSGEWVAVEKYIYRQARVATTSTYCPDCERRAVGKPDSP